MADLKELTIAITGKITASNFSEWKQSLIDVVKGSKRELTSDEDFVQADADVKNLKAGEDALAEAKDKALEQAAEINQLFTDIDEVSTEARDARLNLQSQIKKRKEEIKTQIIDGGLVAIESLVDEQEEVFRHVLGSVYICLLYTSPSPRDQRGSRMPSSA